MAGWGVWGGAGGWEVCVAGGHAWLGAAWQGHVCMPRGVHGWGDMHDWGACVAGGGHAWPGVAWLGACMAKGACMANGGMCGEGSHAWQRGPCMVEGGCA